MISFSFWPSLRERSGLFLFLAFRFISIFGIPVYFNFWFPVYFYIWFISILSLKSLDLVLRVEDLQIRV